MSLTNYTYSSQTDFSHGVATDRLAQEIRSSSISTSLNRIDTVGNTVIIWFNDVLSAGDVTSLNSIIASHSGLSLTSSTFVTLQPLQPIVINAYTTTSGSTFTPIMATILTEVTGMGQRSIKSDQAVDFLSGSGAQQVMITYYDNNMGGPFTETLSLSGTTAVPTVNSNICFVESMNIVSAGSQLGNVGNIRLFSSTSGGGSTMAQIAASDNQTYYAHHYVAANSIARLTTTTGFMKGPNGGNVSIRVSNPLLPNVPEKTISEIVRLAPGVTFQSSPNTPVQIFGPARIVLYAQALGQAGLIDWVVGLELYETSK